MRQRSLAKDLPNKSPAVSLLLSAFKKNNARVRGTSQWWASFSSKSVAPTDVFGNWTTMLNLNPSEFDSDIMFALLQRPYGFQGPWGEPDGRRPTAAERYRMVANNPVAAAQFFHLIAAGFQHVMLGWPVDADQQQNPHCPFGKVTPTLYLVCFKLHIVIGAVQNYI